MSILLHPPILAHMPDPAAHPAATPIQPPVQVAAVAQHSATMATVSPAALQWRRPIPGWGLFQPARPRSAFALPTLISPITAPTDTTLFEEPQDASLHHYLPGYSVATQGSGGSVTKWVSFAKSQSGWILTVHLTESPAPAGATPVASVNTRYLLSAAIDSRAVSWDFDTVTPGPGTLQLSLNVTQIGDRDSIYRALTTPTSGAQIVVRRSFTVASLVPPNPTQPGVFYRQSTPTIDTNIPFTFDLNLYGYVFSQLGSAPGSPSTWQMVSLSWLGRMFHYYLDSAAPTQIYFLPDSFKISRRATAPHSPSISITSTGDDPNAQIYTLSFLAVPVWDPQRIVAATAALQSQLTLGVTPTLALFEAQTTALALNLPGDGSSAPGLVPIAGATIDIGAGISASVILPLAQLQQVYAALFDGVSSLLSGIVTVDIKQGGVTDLVSLPLSARVSEFAGTLFDITTRYEPAFNRFSQTLVNAIESPIHIDALSGVLMNGTTVVPTDSQQVSPKLPADIPPTSAVDPSATPTNSTGSATADKVVTTASTIGNVVVGQTGHGGGNSILGSVFSSLGDVLSGIGGPASKIPGNVLGIPAPPNGLVFSMSPSSGSTVDNNCTVLFDFSDTHVHGNPEAIWDAIMQNQVLGPVKRVISMKVFSSIFTPPTPDPSLPAAAPTSPIRAIQVIFQNGQTANFDSSTTAAGGVMTQTVSLSVAIKAFVLGQGDVSNYQYRVKTIRETGTQTTDWTTSNQDSFYVEVNV